MDGYVTAARKPANHRLYVTRENQAMFGESTARGMLTKNCAESIAAARMEYPEWFDGKPTEASTMGVQPSKYWWRR